MDEQQLIKELQEGKESAFQLIVENHQQKVVNICFGMIHNLEDAEDIAQEVFIEVFNSIQKFRIDSKLSTWLYRISVNKSLNFIRTNKRQKWFQPIDEKQDNDNGLIASWHDQPGYTLENSERAKLMHKVIDELPKNQKVAFTFNKYDDLSYQEISDIMELSISSVESLIHRAKKNLQKKLYACYKKDCI